MPSGGRPRPLALRAALLATIVALVADALLLATGADRVGWEIFDVAATVAWAAAMVWALASR